MAPGPLVSSRPISVWKANRSPPAGSDRAAPDRRPPSGSVVPGFPRPECRRSGPVRDGPPRRRRPAAYRTGESPRQIFDRQAGNPLPHQRTPRKRHGDRRQNGVRGRMAVQAPPGSARSRNGHRGPAGPPAMLPHRYPVSVADQQGARTSSRTTEAKNRNPHPARPSSPASANPSVRKRTTWRAGSVASGTDQASRRGHHRIGCIAILT